MGTAEAAAENVSCENVENVENVENCDVTPPNAKVAPLSPVVQNCSQKVSNVLVDCSDDSENNVFIGDDAEKKVVHSRQNRQISDDLSHIMGQNGENDQFEAVEASSVVEVDVTENSACAVMVDSASGGKVVEFDLTTSSFLENVDSYCNTRATHGSIPSFESTTSSFLLNVNSFCNVAVNASKGDDNYSVMCEAEWVMTKRAMKAQADALAQSEACAVAENNEWCLCANDAVCFWCGLDDLCDLNCERGCLPASSTAVLGTPVQPAQPALPFPDMQSLADALPGCLCTRTELCSWCSNCVVMSSPPIPLENLWDHLKRVKYGERSRAEKRGFGSDAVQGSSTTVTFAHAFKQRAFKDSVNCDLAMKMKRIKISTNSNSMDGFNVPNTGEGCIAGNDENIALPVLALPGNGLSSGASDAAEFLRLQGDASPAASSEF